LISELVRKLEPEKRLGCHAPGNEKRYKHQKLPSQKMFLAIQVVLYIDGEGYT
jgi:hypothetical protein